MGTLKNLSGEPLDVPLLRRTVGKDEQVEVDDALLTNPDIVWPSGTWEVNGGTHEYDPNSPDNLAKAEAEAKAADEAAAKAAQDVAAAPAQPELPIEPNPAVLSTADEHTTDPAPAADTTTEN